MRSGRGGGGGGGRGGGGGGRGGRTELFLLLSPFPNWIPTVFILHCIFLQFSSFLSSFVAYQVGCRRRIAPGSTVFQRGRHIERGTGKREIRDDVGENG